MKNELTDLEIQRWAEDTTTYPAGSRAWSAQPTARAPASDYLTPDTRLPAQHLNYLYRNVGRNLQGLEDNLAAHDRYLGAVDVSIWEAPSDMYQVAQDLGSWAPVMAPEDVVVSAVAYDKKYQRWFCYVDDGVAGGNPHGLFQTFDNGRTWSEFLLNTANYAPSAKGRGMIVDDAGMLVVWNPQGAFFYSTTRTYSGTAVNAPFYNASRTVSSAWLEWYTPTGGDHPIFLAFASSELSGVNTSHLVSLEWNGSAWTSASLLTDSTDVAYNFIGAKADTTTSPTILFSQTEDRTKTMWRHAHLTGPVEIAQPAWHANVYPKSLTYIATGEFTGFVFLGQSKQATDLNYMQLFTSDDDGDTWTEVWSYLPSSPAETDPEFTEIVAVGGQLIAIAGNDDATGSGSYASICAGSIYFTTSQVTAGEQFTKWTRAACGHLFGLQPADLNQKWNRIRANSRGQLAAVSTRYVQFSLGPVEQDAESHTFAPA